MRQRSLASQATRSFVEYVRDNHGLNYTELAGVIGTARQRISDSLYERQGSLNKVAEWCSAWNKKKGDCLILVSDGHRAWVARRETCRSTR